ncbi:MAG: hypothetical protein MZU91_14510 [Desulfosudis oleivorans]|nr:hypothetical protein [Desulfosudis oleivorans]
MSALVVNMILPCFRLSVLLLPQQSHRGLSVPILILLPLLLKVSSIAYFPETLYNHPDDGHMNADT